MTTLLALGLGTFLLGLVLSAFAGEWFERPSAGHDTASRSLVGHHALRVVLERLGLSVVVARDSTTARAAPRFPLLLLEPGALDGQLSGDTPDEPAVRAEWPQTLTTRLARAAEDGGAVVLAAPKWRVEPSEQLPGFAGVATLRPIEEVTRALALPEALDGIAPPSPPPEDLLAEAPTTSASPRLLRPDTLGECAAPALELPHPAIVLESPQVFASSSARGPDAPLEPIVSCESGVLVARSTRAPHLILVSDPDLLSNRGLALGDHANLVAALLGDELSAEGVVVDETIHGQTRAPSILRLALSFPLVLVFSHAALVLALVGWSVSLRFGAPRAPPPALPPGKGLLIDNAARLLLAARAHDDSLQRYLEMTLARAAREALTPGPGDPRLRLAALARARGAPEELEPLARAVLAGGHTPSEVRRLALRVHAWARVVRGRAPTLPHPTRETP